MDHQGAGAWLAAYRRAWEQADTRAVLGLFTGDARYHSHPLRPVHAGHDAIAAYWTAATATQRDVRVRLGDPVVEGDRVAVEWWTTMTADGDPATLAGCLLLSFAGDGRCRMLRECWHLAGQVLDPPADWGRLEPSPGRGAPRTAREPGLGRRRPGPRARPPLGRGLRASLAGRRPRGRGRPLRPATYYRSEPFRDPHLGREGVLAYTRRAYATEADQDPRFGTSVASATAAAAEWWATMLEEGRPATIVGTSFLTFTPDGLVATARDYWFLEPGTHQPFEGWGR